jgi:lysyl-tRNA synthetase class I
MHLQGIDFEPIHYECQDCGRIDKINYKYVAANNSIQARCACGKWIKNVPHKPKRIAIIPVKTI